MYAFSSILPAFIIFTNVLTSLKLDGFLIHLPGDIYGKDLHSFSTAFKEILYSLAESDPTGKNCMKSTIDRTGWVNIKCLLIWKKLVNLLCQCFFYW